MTQLDAILRTIEEVEVSLAKRAERAGALVMLTWGLVGTGILLFYGLAEQGGTWEGYDRRTIQWAWVAPVALGYVLTALAQVRLGRARREPDGRGIARLLVFVLVPVALVVAMSVTRRATELVPALWVAFLGFMHLAWRPGVARTDRAIGLASFAAALVLALPPAWPFAYFGAAAWYAVFLAGHGAYRYHQAR